MKKFESDSDKQKKNENLNMFIFANENRMEVLNNYEMNQIKGGEGDDDDKTDWK